MSNNNLKGSIPESIGNLVNLKNLDLSNNNLSGQIPEDFAKLENIWHLNLSKNDLCGEIPLSLYSLLFRKKLPLNTIFNKNKFSIIME